MLLNILQKNGSKHEDEEPKPSNINSIQNAEKLIHILPAVKPHDNYIESNASAIEFSKSSVKYINKISQPICSFGVSIFTYCRIFTNGSLLYLSSDEEWVEHYFSNNYQDDVNHFNHYLPKQDIKYGLWNEFNMDKVFQSVYDDFNYWHGISFYEKNNNYMDYFDFGADKDNEKMASFYLNNLSMLSQFIQYFKGQVSELVSKADATKLVYTRTVAEPRENFSKQPRVKKLQVLQNKQENPSDNGIVLTCNEKECLYYLYQGKSVKEIGKFLRIPAKSVEFYINCIKLKAQGLTKSELHNVLKGDSKFSIIFSDKLNEKRENPLGKTVHKLFRFYHRLVDKVIIIGGIILFFLYNLFEIISNLLYSFLGYCY